MSAFTYLNPSEFLKPTSNTVVNQHLKDLRRQTGQDWRIQETIYRGWRKWLFWRRPDYKLYTVYLESSAPEFQIINFWLDHDWSINQDVPADVVINWLMGQLDGMRYAKHTLKNVKGLKGVDPEHPFPRILDYVKEQTADV